MIGRNPYRALEKALGHRFRRRRWLEEALTHPSFAHEQTSEQQDNQRLEFLGDAALGLVAAAALYEAVPEAREGQLTKLRSLVSSTKALAQLAQSVELGVYLRLGRGEDMGGGRIRPTILADALEAILGAAYLDGGLKAVQKIFRCVFEPRLRELGMTDWHENPKGELQEYVQRNGNGTPRYHVISEEGPPHQRTFTVEVHIKGEPCGTGQGSTKREAETQAALQALLKFSS